MTAREWLQNELTKARTARANAAAKCLTSDGTYAALLVKHLDREITHLIARLERETER